ncbi:MAG: hypothetical protein M9942_04035 [Microthrixaceae bacterium]|nr:hypothetical protein [Microthrixaceae bacterium]
MSDEQIIVALAAIVVLGVGAQWIAKRRDFPALLLLLPAGLLAGNVGDLVDPEALFGETLFPGVTMLVGLLLFSSGLRLRFADLPPVARGPVLRLNTIGALLTLAGSACAVWVVARPDIDLAILTGAILVVSGPTVVGPLLDAVRPREPVGSILLWEGTVLDPIGATMGVVALNLVLASERVGLHPVLQMAGRLGLGVAVGVVAGALLVFVMSRFLVTDQMEAAVSLLFAVAAFSVAEYFLSEAGLFATVTLGLVVANQTIVPTDRIAGFGETLEVLIIGGLFIVLGALVDLDELLDRAWQVIVLVAVLVVVVRPLSVFASLVGTDVAGNERSMISWVDPRGVVAAATAAAFAGTLGGEGIESDFLVPVVFGVILGTGVLYGLTAAPVASLLKVRTPEPHGLLLVGEQAWLVDLAHCLAAVGVRVSVASERSVGLPEVGVPGPPSQGSDSGQDDLVTHLPMDSVVGEEQLREGLERSGIGKAVVVLSHDPRSQMATADLVEVLGRRRVYRVRSDEGGSVESRMIRAATAVAFGASVTETSIGEMVDSGARVVELSAHDLADSEPGSSLVLAVVDPDGTVHVGEHRTDPTGAVEGARFVGLRLGAAETVGTGQPG